MDKSDAILATVSATGSPLQGRTTLQKLAYFETQKGLFSADFKPHYYGPYSEEIAGTVQGMVSLGYLAENVTLLGSQIDPWLAAVGGDVKVFSYELTKEGRQLADQIKKEQQREWKELANVVGAAKRYSNLSPGVLSVAAKVHYVLRRIDQTPITVERVKDEARKFSWDLEEDQIESAANLLSKLSLLGKA